MMRRSKSHRTVGGVLSDVPTKALLVVLVSALLAAAAWIGRAFERRVEALELHKQEQNGHLRELRTDVQWIKQKLGDR